MSTKAKTTQKSKFIAVHSMPKGVSIKGTIVKCNGWRGCLFLSDTGTLYNTSMPNKTVTMSEREKIASYYDTPVLNALKSLGIITAKEMRESIACVKANEKKQDIHDKENRLKNTGKALGIPESEVASLIKKYAPHQS